MSNKEGNGIVSTKLFKAMLWVVISCSLIGCENKKPVRIGLSVELTGRHGDLGVQSRNGELLAVETLNAESGIHGRPIELVVRDDKGTPEEAQVADQELIDAGVVAIIGHITSAQTLTAYHVSEAAGIILISPTTSIPELSGQKDHFFRLVAPNPKEGRILARYFRQQQQWSRIAVIYETDNAAFTGSLLDSFTESYRRLGGEIVSSLGFSSSSNPDFAALVTELQKTQAEGMLLIASAVDVALIAQRVRIQEWQVPLIETAWTQTQDLIHKGGQAVEGIQILQSYDPNNTSPEYQDFQARFEKRFGNVPPLYAGNAYDTVLVLTAALAHTKQSKRFIPGTYQYSGT
jgi:branched-chain amino acid transport system substrate-binding protein